MPRKTCLLIVGLVLCRLASGLAQQPPAEAARLVAQLAQEQEKARRADDSKMGVQDAVDKVVGALDAIVITASRHEERLFETPHHAHIAGRETLHRSRTVQDALRDTPGIHLQRTSYGQTSPYLRGFTGYHTVMLIDGIRLNNSVLRSGPNEYWGLVDGQSLDRVEAIFGPGAVLYGSDAVGGAVNAITTRREEFGPGTSWDTTISLRGSTAEKSVVGRTQVSGNVGEDLGFVFGASGGGYGNLNAGGSLGRQPGTNYHDWFSDGRIDLHLDDRWSLGILAQVARVENVDRVHRTVNGVSFAGTSVGSDRTRTFDWERELVGVFLDGVGLGGFADEVHVRLSWQRIGETQTRVRGDGRINESKFLVDTFGVAVELVSETALGELTYGADWYHDEVDTSRRDTSVIGVSAPRIQGVVGDDASYDLLGLFLQDRLALGDVVDLVLGGRLTHAAAQAGRVQDPVTGLPISINDDWFSAVGSARVLWRAMDSLNLYAGVSRAFRAPNLSDLTRLDSARSGELEVASPGLDPEHFWSFEIGAKARWEGLAASVAYHYTIIDDLIIRQPTTQVIDGEIVVIKRNAGAGHAQGVEVDVRYDFCDNWEAFGTFHWLDGEVETFPTSAPVSTKEVLSRLPPLGGSLGGEWHTEDREWRVRAWARLVDRQDRLSTRDQADTSRIPPGGTPGYVVFNLDASYRFAKGSEAFIAIENLLDKNYRVHGSGVQEPGFNIVVGVTVTF